MTTGQANDETTPAVIHYDDRACHSRRDREGSYHVVVVGSAARVAQPLPLRLDLTNKSPTGFGWGYGGFGPSQLALALCADALGDEMAALTIYQDFQFRVLGNLPRKAPWTLTAGKVREHCRELEARSSVGRDDP